MKRRVIDTAKRIAGRFGIQISKANSSNSYGLGKSRVTIGGMAEAIESARARFPDRDVIALVDRPTDLNGTAFAQALDVSCETVSGNPAQDLDRHDLDAMSIVLGLDSDQKASGYLDYLTKKGGKYFCSHDISNARWWHLSDAACEVMLAEREDCQKNDYPLFEADQLANLMQGIDITRDHPGEYVEIGVFKGTSARLAYRYMNATGLQRKCYFIDTFAGFDYDEATTSSDASWPGKFDASMEMVDQRLRAVPSQPDHKTTYELVKSNIIADELPTGIESIAMCNIDVDIYDAILVALRKTWPLLVQRGVCMVQDPGRTPWLGGARLALDQFVGEVDCQAVYMESGQTMLFKV